jgi:Tfp pilus assembly protein PilO
MAGVAAVACIGLTVAAYAVGVRPLLARHQHEAAQRELLAERSAAIADGNAALAGLNRELADAKEALARTPLRLQPAALINQRLEAVARLASECGVSLDEMRPGSPADSTHYQTVPIRIVGGGTYPACATFLRKLRRTFGDMGVSTFSAANATPSARTALASFQAELVWFTETPRK